jgi:hypothetical protein
MMGMEAKPSNPLTFTSITGKDNILQEFQAINKKIIAV